MCFKVSFKSLQKEQKLLQMQFKYKFLAKWPNADEFGKAQKQESSAK